MKPFLDVPFLPDAGYAAFLGERADSIVSVQFSLQGDLRLDSRVQLESGGELSELLELLHQVDGPKKYALLNSRFYAPTLLTRQNGLDLLIDSLRLCADQGQLDGIIYCDHYLLQYLSDAAPDLAVRLEAVPGVNMLLDSFAKIEALIGYIGATRFRPPGKIVLDRRLNRDLDQLAEVAFQTRNRFPDMQIEVLANEGCLLHCPFKLSHDAYIALANLEHCDHTGLLNRELGCMRYFDEHPHRILQSPFIRPEDSDLYLYHVDGIKLCGRTLGPAFLQRAVNAYLDKRYDGNLLDLFDAMNWLADRLHVDNSALSFDFANMLSMCASQCENCGFCEELFPSIAKTIPINLPDQRRRQG